MRYFVYMVRCSDNSLYTGFTNNLDKRIKQHNGDLPGGAQYTRSKRPVEYVYQEVFDNQRDAMRREIEIKKLNHKEKEELAQNNSF